MGCSTRTRRAASLSPFGGSQLLSTGPFPVARDDVKEGMYIYFHNYFPHLRGGGRIISPTYGDGNILILVRIPLALA